MGIAGLLALAVLLFPVANRLKFPYTIMLAVTGILLGSLKLLVAGKDIVFASYIFEALDGVEITLDLVMYVFLPALVFESALSIDIRRLIDDIAPILFLAVFGVLIVTFTVGFALDSLVPYGFVACLLLGTIISSTDPVAVVSIFKNVGAPKRLSMLVEGESLFNDAAAIVLFTLLSGMILGQTEPSLSAGVLSFISVFVGGVAVGYVIATAYCWIFGWIGEIPIAKTTLSITLPYLCLVLGEAYLQVSGVMAAVTAGLVVASRGRSVISPSNWSALQDIWDQIGFIANSMIFLLMGLAVPVIMQNVGINELVLLLILTLVVLVARVLIMFGLLPLMSRARLCDRVEFNYRVVMCWGGLLGAVPLALALAVLEDDQFPTEIQTFIGLLAGSYVLVTLFLNGTTLPILIRRLGLNKLSRTDTLIKERALANAGVLLEKTRPQTGTKQ